MSLSVAVTTTYFQLKEGRRFLPGQHHSHDGQVLLAKLGC